MQFIDFWSYTNFWHFSVKISCLHCQQLLLLHYFSDNSRISDYFRKFKREMHNISQIKYTSGDLFGKSKVEIANSFLPRPDLFYLSSFELEHLLSDF